MISLKIDGRAVDIDEKIDPAITIGIADIEEPENSSSGYSKTVEIPFTPHNMRVFGFTNELFSREQFNNALHTADYAVDDTVVMCGIAQIEKFSYTAGRNGQVTAGKFHVTVIGSSYEWITNARKKISELTNGETVTYTLDEVYKNSIRKDVSLIKFFPVDRGAFYTTTRDADNNEVTTPRNGLNVLDYHPFINLWKLLLLIFKGYTLHSSMKEVFSTLYFSGYMPEIEDLSELKEENDFKCGSTLSDRTIEMRGYQAKAVNLFDKWVRENNNEDFFVATEGILSKPSSSFCTVYKPTGNISAIFKLNVNFEMPVVDGSFVDTLKFGYPGSTFILSLKDSIQAQDGHTTEWPWGGRHVCFIKFKNPEKILHILQVDQIFGDDDIYRYDEYTIITEAIKPAGQYLEAADGDRRYHQLVLEDGSQLTLGTKEATAHIEEFFAVGIPYGVLNFDLTGSQALITQPYAIKGNQDLPFSVTFSYSNYITTLSGKEYTIKVGATCDITPDFKNVIGTGDNVNISTIGGAETQLDFLASIRQLFNLMFYTNPLSKEVFVEPRTSFYNLDRNAMIDWREKIDYSKEIIVEELGSDVGNSLKLAYADGPDVVQRYNWKNHTEIGAYTIPLKNKVADEVKEIVNPTFAPFLLRHVVSVGMTIPQNAPEKNQDIINEVELDITPIIGRFDGIYMRTKGTDLSKYPRYPRLVFQDQNAGINMGFDDLQSTPVLHGLNQYYQSNISAYNVGRRLTMYLKLEPQDIEAILLPNGLMRDLRGVFIVQHDGENVPCLLEGISDYNPAGGTSVKCQFVVDPNIQMYGRETIITYNGVMISYGGAVIKYENERII